MLVDRTSHNFLSMAKTCDIISCERTYSSGWIPNHQSIDISSLPLEFFNLSPTIIRCHPRHKHNRLCEGVIKQKIFISINLKLLSQAWKRLVELIKKDVFVNLRFFDKVQKRKNRILYYCSTKYRKRNLVKMSRNSIDCQY